MSAADISRAAMTTTIGEPNMARLLSQLADLVHELDQDITKHSRSLAESAQTHRSTLDAVIELVNTMDTLMRIQKTQNDRIVALEKAVRMLDK